MGKSDDGLFRALCRTLWLYISIILLFADFMAGHRKTQSRGIGYMHILDQVERPGMRYGRGLLGLIEGRKYQCEESLELVGVCVGLMIRCQPSCDLSQAFKMPHPETANSLSSPPDLLVVNLAQLLLQILSVRLASVEFKRPASLGSVTNRLIELLKNRKIGTFPRQLEIYVKRLLTL